MSGFIKFSSGEILTPNHLDSIRKDLIYKPILHEYGCIDYKININQLNKGFLEINHIDVIFPNGERIITDLSENFQISYEESGEIIYCYVKRFEMKIKEELTDNGSLIALTYNIPVIGFSYESTGNKIPFCKVIVNNGKFDLMKFDPPCLNIKNTINLKSRLEDFYKLLTKLHTILICNNDSSVFFLVKAIYYIDIILNPYELFINLLEIFSYTTKDKLKNIIYNHNDIFSSFENILVSIENYFEYQSVSNQVKNFFFNKIDNMFYIKLDKNIKDFIKIIVDSNLSLADTQKIINESKIATDDNWEEITKNIITGAPRDFIQTIGGKYVFNLEIGRFITPNQTIQIYHYNFNGINSILLAEKFSNF